MTITYPRTLPFSGSIFGSGSDLTLSRADARNRDGSGMIEVMELGDPLWQLRLVTKPLRPTVRAAWKAFLESLQGGIQLFYGYHPILQYPIAHGVAATTLFRAPPYGTILFDGTAELLDKGADFVSLGRLPVGFVVSPGDMISVPLTTGSRMLHRVIELAAANSSGAANGITVTPSVRSETVALGNTDVRMIRAPALFVLKHETISAPDGEILAPVSFEAVQTVRSI